jgi:hypothetical protein
VEVKGKAGVAVHYMSELALILHCSSPQSYAVSLDKYRVLYPYNPNLCERQDSLFFNKHTGSPLGGFGANTALIATSKNDNTSVCTSTHHFVEFLMSRTLTMSMGLEVLKSTAGEAFGNFRDG